MIWLLFVSFRLEEISDDEEILENPKFKVKKFHSHRNYHTETLKFPLSSVSFKEVSKNHIITSENLHVKSTFKCARKEKYVLIVCKIGKLNNKLYAWLCGTSESDIYYWHNQDTKYSTLLSNNYPHCSFI